MFCAVDESPFNEYDAAYDVAKLRELLLPSGCLEPVRVISKCVYGCHLWIGFGRGFSWDGQVLIQPGERQWVPAWDVIRLPVLK